MQVLTALMSLAIYIALGLWIAQRDRVYYEEEEEPELFDSIRLEAEVEALHKQMRKLREYDEMIIDLRLCKPEAVQRAFRMEWMSAAGVSHALDVWADGENPSTQYMLHMAIEERAALNADIQARIRDIYIRACMEDFHAEIEREKSMTV